MINILIFLIGLAILICGVFRYPHTDNNVSVVAWIPVNIISIICFHGIICGVLYLLSLPIHIAFIGIFDAILGVLLVLFEKKRGIQRYYIDKFEVCVFALLIAVTGAIFFARFGRNLIPNFNSPDAATHFDFAKYIIEQKSFSNNLFLSALDDSLWMSILKSLTGDFGLYKSFLIAETFHLFLSGSIFASLIMHHLKNNIMKIGGICIVLFYYTGYPYYAFGFGFSYFGLSITIIAFVLFILKEWYENGCDKRFVVVMLWIGLAGVFTCYTYFVPVVFFGVFLSILLWSHRSHPIISLDTIKTMLLVFLLPTAYGLLQSFSNIMYLNIGNNGEAQDTTSSVSGIAIDGGCFNDMYSSFIILIPFVVIGVWMIIKSHKLYDPIVCMLFVLILFSGILFVYAMQLKVSVYYFVKGANLMWLLFMLLFIKGMSYLSEKAPIVIVSTAVTFGLLLGMVAIDFDKSVTAVNPRFIRAGAGGFVAMHSFNYDFLKMRYFDKNHMDLLEYVYDNTNNSSLECICVGDDYFACWAKSICNQSLYVVTSKPKTAMSYLQDETKYILLEKGGLLPQDVSLWEKYANVIVDNPGGVIMELK